MRRSLRLAISPGLPALAILMGGALSATAQERPGPPALPTVPGVTAPAASAGGWSGYRPAEAWGPGHPGILHAGDSLMHARVFVPPSGWAHYAPASAWTAYYRPRIAAEVAPRAPAYVPRSGWATYAPSSAWTTYQAGSAWQSYEPAAVRPLNMRQARVPGPSPYADGLARNYIEYGTGRPVPLAKPWLPGAP